MKIEIVTTQADQPYHARIKGDNGEIVWTTENYSRKFDAVHAVTELAAAFGHAGSQFVMDVDRPGSAHGTLQLGHDPVSQEPRGITFTEVKE